MSIIDGALSANATIATGFVSRAAPPKPKIVMVTCADPRMTGIAEMIGLADADVDLIRNLGSVIDEDSIRGILEGSVVGWYPIEANVERGIIQGAADLTLPCVIDRMLVASRHASLTASSRNRLRLAIARTGALRTPELGFELEEIVGDRIDGASLVDQDPMTIQLDLRRKGSITLLATPGEPGEGGPTRTSNSAPKKQASKKQ
jgi:hypothetical protein